MYESVKEGWKQLRWLADEFNSLENDESRYRFIFSHPGVFACILDNDDTSVEWSSLIYNAFGEMGEGDFPRLMDMDECLGNSEGISILLTILGVEHSKGV